MKKLTIFTILWLAASVLFSNIVFAKDARDDLRAFLERTKTVKMTFFQTTFDKNGKASQNAEGTLWIARPDGFRWETEKPFPQLIVGNKKRVWFYDPDLNQVIVRARDVTLSGTPAALLSGSGDVTRVFTLKVLPDQDGMNYVEAMPKDTASANFTHVKLGFQSGQLKTLEVTDAFDQKIVTRFLTVEENALIKESHFTFTPPKDADVIESEQ